MTTFKRGDGVVFARIQRVAMIGEPSHDRDDIEVGKVVSVTRDGQIKAYESHYGNRVILANSVYKYATAYLLPRDDWDITAVLEYMHARPWSHAPEHKGMPFGSLAEARAELKQFKIAGKVPEKTSLNA